MVRLLSVSKDNSGGDSALNRKELTTNRQDRFYKGQQQIPKELLS